MTELVPTIVDPVERSWWTPTGWERHDEPDDFASVVIFADQNWERAGYFDRVIFGQEESCWSYLVEIREHRDHHRAVILDRPHVGWIDVFFVAAEHVTAFLVDKLPSLLTAAAAVDQASDIAALSKAVIAFVRHGHGQETINSTGTESRDDMWMRQSAEKYVRARKAGVID